jgi:hypothetical protein
MDPLHAMIALGPLAIYFLMLGSINLRSRPTVVNGMADTTALGLAIAGFVVAGPMELFLPEAVASLFTWGVWPLLITFYLLCLTLYVLLMRPALVIYNVTAEQLRPELAEVITRLDKQARIAGDSMYLPELGIQFHLDTLSVLKNVQLKSIGAEQNYAGWRDLEIALRAQLKQSKGTANPYGISLMTFGAIMCGLIGYFICFEATEIAQAWKHMLRLSP